MLIRCYVLSIIRHEAVMSFVDQISSGNGMSLEGHKVSCSTGGRRACEQHPYRSNFGASKVIKGVSSDSHTQNPHEAVAVVLPTKKIPKVSSSQPSYMLLVSLIAAQKNISTSLLRH